MSDDTQGSGFSWFLAGLGIGALVGVLFAPKAGQETREDLAGGARDGAEYLKQKSRETADQVSVLVERGKSQVNDLVDQSKTYFDRSKDQIDQAVAQGRDMIREHADKVTAAVDAGKQAYTNTTTTTT